MKIRRATSGDMPGISALQEMYLVDNMTDSDKTQGFVTTAFTKKQLEYILGQGGIFVAEDEGSIIAYLFGGDWDFYHQWEIFKYMTSRFKDIHYAGLQVSTKNSFQYGPVSIHENYRGRGLVNTLFEALRLEFIEKYPLALTFINKANPRSLKAHVDKIGWEIVDEFEFNDNQYYSLAYDMGRCALPPA